MTENTFSQPQTWTRSRILFSALAARITLVLYSHIHDYIFKVNFTDIDYHVFSDAARHVWKGGSPYDRPTYRYTPALAWILLPVVNFPDFGKLLFCFCDIFVAWIMLQVLDRQELQHKKESTKNTTSENNKKICLLDDQVKLVVLFWLANPLTAIISARGNAEAIVAAAVLLTILLLQTGYWKTAALVHGALAIHLKIYPLIYLPSVFLQLSSYGKQKDFSSKFKALLFNWKGHVYLIITLSSFAAIVLFFYQIYGDTTIFRLISILYTWWKETSSCPN
ncbi:unnamed protein product [Caenorhabditis auriculariae]|uniref:GPI alpha-1,4-mannosyltransferase I, catalytic subunit n=1 Tax=Caenorhabditis auriculariae TaxID=2777116 RepID=A0A8S1H708_9PELO|nr:unnamed protein product [Caenorhabditis auriculariae]